MNVSEYYKKDCSEKQDCRCKPAYYPYPDPDEKDCGFSEEKLVTTLTDKIKILEKYDSSIIEKLRQGKSPETFDFLEEFPILILKAGTILCHSTRVSTILQYKYDTKNYNYSPSAIGWWKTYFVGQSKYGGGWFTYESGYGGPGFGMLLYYKVQKDIPVLFVPNYKVKRDDKRYYPDGDHPFNGSTDDLYTGSHVLYGVKNWKEKGYEKITPKYYADEFAERIFSLGFPGYISCDECEVYLTHKTMTKSVYERPYRMVYTGEYYMNCKNCGKRGASSINCTKCKKPHVRDENLRTIFHLMVESLCDRDDKCPLKINEGDRDKIDMELLPLDKIVKILPKEQFDREYSNIIN